MFYSLCVCVCTWPPVREVCPKYELVVFQPWTVTPLHLVSIAVVKLKLYLPPHLFLPFVSIFLLSPPSYLPPICSRSLLRSSIICTPSEPPLLTWSAAHLDVAHTCYPTASDSYICILRRMPQYTVVLVTALPPPLLPSAL